MTNYYEELNLDTTLSVEELQKNLNKLESTWIRREATNPEKARAMRVLIDEARKVFQTEGSRTQYDLELKNADKKPPVVDERSEEREKWLNEANSYYQMGQYDLAKTAVQRAMQFLNPSEINDVAYSIAADIYYQAGEPQRALEYINNAIMENNTRSYYIIRQASIYRMLSQNRNVPNHYEYAGKVRPTIEWAIDVANQYDSEMDQGRAYGYYALDLYYQDPKQPVQAEEYAKKALRFGDSWGFGRNVLDAVEQVRQEEQKKLQKKKYDEAVTLANSESEQDWKRALEIFRSISAYEDSAKCIEHLQARMQAYESELEKTRLEAEETERQKGERAKKRQKMLCVIAIGMAVAAILAFGIWTVKNRLEQKQNYAQAEELLDSGDRLEAAIAFGKAGGYADAQARSRELWEEYVLPSNIAVGDDCIAAIKDDGTVAFVEGRSGSGYEGVNTWENMVSVKSTYEHLVGLRTDGTVVAAGENTNGCCNVSKWKNIVDIYAGTAVTYGLRSDGTIVSTGEPPKLLNRRGNVVQILGDDLAMTADGGLVHIDDWSFEFNSDSENMERTIDRENAKQVFADAYGVFQLNEDGSVTQIVAYETESAEGMDFSLLQNIRQLSGNSHYMISGVTKDGRVIHVTTYEPGTDLYCSTEKMCDVVEAGTGLCGTVGIKTDGTADWVFTDWAEADMDRYAETLSEWSGLRVAQTE